MTRLLAAAALSILTLPGLALAQPRLQSSSPAAGATIARPTTLTLAFSEPLEADGHVELVMTGMPGMADHPPMPIKGFTTALAPDGKGLVVTLPRALPAGSYDLAWHVMGADRQPAEGRYSFTVR